MSAKAIENGKGFAADPLLQESQSDEEEDPAQPSSSGSTPRGLPHQPTLRPDGPGSDSTGPPQDSGGNISSTAKMIALAVTGGVVAVGAVPVVLGAMGFTGAGIAASSLAAKMMSSAAIANGGGVAAGSLVATLQSVGAAGLSTSTNVLLGMAGTSIGALAGRSKKAHPSSPPARPSTEAKRDAHVGGDPQDDNPPNDKPASENCSEKDEK